MPNTHCEVFYSRYGLHLKLCTTFFSTVMALKCSAEIFLNWSDPYTKKLLQFLSFLLKSQFRSLLNIEEKLFVSLILAMLLLGKMTVSKEFNFLSTW